MKEKVFFDELNEDFDDVDRFDLEMWFNNKKDHQKYVMFGKAERWDIKGENANGYFDKTFNSLLEAIDEATRGCGICYLKIYEENYGRLYVDVIHHDGNNSFEIRELTKYGKKMLENHYYDYDNIIQRLITVKKYTRNVKFSNKYW